ncbi:copper oxidase, partial [Pedobacter jamesrossensis]
MRSGHFSTKINNEWKRIAAMDVSDVYYEKFLINGKPFQVIPDLKQNDKIRLRIINGSASTYFWLAFAGGKITVVANDGQDVRPVEVDRLIIGVSETYDIVVTIPKNMKYEFLATSEDRTSSTSLWLGEGMEMPMKRLPPLNYFKGMAMMNGMMGMNGSMKEMKMSYQLMDMNKVMYPEISADKMANIKMVGSQMSANSSMAGMDMGNQTSKTVTLNYTMLKALKNTSLPDWPTRTMNFETHGQYEPL